MKTLILDIETAPSVAYVWRFFKENISAKQVLEHSHIMSFAAKWLDSNEIFYKENRTSNDKTIMKQLCKLLDKADVVVAHNGVKFDLPKIYGRSLVHGINPPSPSKIVDTCKIARREFGFESNSLEYLATVLKCDHKKSSHRKFPGFELWLECLRKNEEAWEELQYYNIEDVLVLEDIYLKMLPYIKNHPNTGLINSTEDPACPKCGSTHLQKRGYAYTSVSKFQRYSCNSCGGWSRSRFRENKNDKHTLVNV